MGKVVVFDLGGTLFEFEGMTLSWTGYYPSGFKRVNEKFGLGLTEEQLKAAETVLIENNPRVNHRENEIPAETLFEKAVESWDCNIPVDKIIEEFFAGLELKPRIFDYAFDLIARYRNEGCKIACMTDIPSAMPDRLYIGYIEPLLGALDLYVSSQSCGFRKPNPSGLKQIAEHFGVKTGELLLIGDEEKDRKTAENAGCEFAFIKDVV